jgi:rhodanese-related sulfurtransferase
MEPRYISPSQAATKKDVLIVDIRPTEEREELGFIPGSVSVPLSPTWSEQALPSDLLPGVNSVVLACLSGQRALHAWRDQLRAKPTFILEGGTLAWGAKGLPLVTISKAQEQLEGVNSPGDFLQNLRSCFVAEWIESTLSSDVEIAGDPIQIVESSLSAEGISEHSFSLDAVHRVFDRLAWHSLRAGTSHAKIAANINMMRNTLRSVTIR